MALLSELACSLSHVCSDLCLCLPQLLRRPAVHPVLLHRLHTLPLLHMRAVRNRWAAAHGPGSSFPSPRHAGLALSWASVHQPLCDKNKDEFLLLRCAFDSVRMEEFRTTASCLNPKYQKTFDVPTPGTVPFSTIWPKGRLKCPFSSGLSLAQSMDLA